MVLLRVVLVPVNATQRMLLAEGHTITSERWIIIEQSKTSLPDILFVAVVFWLTILFMGLSLFSPQNKITMVASFLGCMSVCGPST